MVELEDGRYYKVKYCARQGGEDYQPFVNAAVAEYGGVVLLHSPAPGGQPGSIIRIQLQPEFLHQLLADAVADLSYLKIIDLA